MPCSLRADLRNEQHHPPLPEMLGFILFSLTYRAICFYCPETEQRFSSAANLQEEIFLVSSGGGKNTQPNKPQEIKEKLPGLTQKTRTKTYQELHKLEWKIPRAKVETLSDESCIE